MKTDEYKILSIQIPNNLPFYGQIIAKVATSDDKDAAESKCDDSNSGVSLQLCSLQSVQDNRKFEGIFSRFEGFKTLQEVSDDSDKNVKFGYRAEYSQVNDLISWVADRKSRGTFIIKDSFDTFAYTDVFSDVPRIWKQLYKRKDVLQKLADEYMAKYDLEKEIEKRALRQSALHSDDEGFTLVTRGPGVKLAEVHSTVKKQRLSKNRNLLNFYKFQNKNIRSKD